jgi:hypothetical protein
MRRKETELGIFENEEKAEGKRFTDMCSRK